MRRKACLMFTLASNAILTTVSLAQTNSYISTTDGFWDEARLWSLGQPPSVTQSAILITNEVSETVTIDSITASTFANTLTISNLTINPQTGGTNTLYLDNTGTIALHILDSLTVGITGVGSDLISTNSTLIVDGSAGGRLQDNGTIIITDGSLITTNCSLQVAGSLGSPANAMGLLILSNAFVQARDVTIASASPSSGTLDVIGGTMKLSSSLSIGTGEEQAQGSLLVANGALLVVTNGAIMIGFNSSFSESGGSITVTNATMIAGDWSGGDLSVESGTVTLEGSLSLGDGYVSLNGGSLVVTNNSTTIGEYMGFGELTIEDGTFLAREIFVGTEFQEDGILSVNGGITRLSSYLQVGGFSGLSDGSVSVNGGQLVVTNDEIIVERDASIVVSDGMLAANHVGLDGNFVAGVLSINGGSVTASTGITLGDCVSNTIGHISLDGGRLIVTNSTHTGFIDIQNGQLVLSSGTLQIDKLVMTNSCSSFVHTGGTLIVGSVVLDPNAFAITSIAREGNDLLITWLMAPGTTNALQVSSGDLHGSYTTNGFTDIFIVTNNTTTGTLTNYLDIGAAANKPSRYYRARLAP